MKKSDIVEIKTGKIQGYIDDEIVIFKKIPYAEPPVEELRFKKPVPKEPWEGVLNCTKYGPAAWQGYTQLEEWLGEYKHQSEDCLHLNIWTPATDNAKRPVMFWIHGGAFIIGSGIDPLYAGKELAKRGNIVVVTINYRLGLFGFPYVKGETLNIGSLDQILALKWLKNNIEKFGGDPNKVTIFGESAGAYSVLALCAMPSAKGLFKRVIAESAPAIELGLSEKTTKKILRTLGIKGKNIEEARNIPPEKIIDAQNKFFEANPTDILALRPLIDGKIFAKHPLIAFKEGECKDIDFMIGTNKDEAKLFTAMKALAALVNQGEKALIGILGMSGFTIEKSKEITEQYKEIRGGKLSNEPKELIDAIMTDLMFRIPTVKLLEAQSLHQPNTYNYLFAYETSAMDGVFGACHALEIPFVFGTLDSSTIQALIESNEITRELSPKLMDAWISFARTGNPNHDGIPSWPEYNSDTRSTMVFDEEVKVVNGYREKERQLWE